MSCSGLDQVDVIDASSYEVVQTIPIPARQPRALERIGSAVYVLPYLSGNGTVPFGPSPDEEPTQVVHLEDVPGAATLPDSDLFKIQISPVIGADALDLAGTVSALGTTLLNLHHRPGTNELWIPNLDALNAVHHGEVNFVEGQVTRNQISIVDVGQSPPAVRFIDMDLLAPSPGQRASIPSSVAFSPDGTRAFVTGYGSDRVAVLDIGPQGQAAWAGSIRIGSLGPYPEFSGPRSCNVSADGKYLVIYNKVDNSFSRIELATLPNSPQFDIPFNGSRKTGFDRMPSAMKRGRGLFDNTKTSISNTSSCFSCHPDGDFDGLAWELSAFLDPEGTSTDNLQFGVDVKGPMVTQGARALREIGPFHWRGERKNLEGFNATFPNLFENVENGQAATIGGDFFYIQQYMEELVMAPNPRQALDRSYDSDELRGADFFLNRPVQDGNSCADCHQLPLGTTNEIVETFRGGEAPTIVVPQLRALYNKLSPEFSPGGGVGKRTELGAGLNHSGVAATIQDVALESDEAGNQLFNITPQQANLVADFIEALDTGLAPSTAFQFTAHSGNLASVQTNELPFLLNQAAQGHCEVVFVVRAASALAPQPYVTGMYLSLIHI